MKIVYSYYVLDVLHEGHLRHMFRCKNLAGFGGTHIAGILSDAAALEKKPKPIMSLNERMKVARSIKYIDVVLPQNTYSPIENIKDIKPDIVAESFSHSKKDIDETKKIVKKWGGEVIVLPYFNKQSSSKLKEMILHGKSTK